MIRAPSWDPAGSCADIFCFIDGAGEFQRLRQLFQGLGIVILVRLAVVLGEFRRSCRGAGGAQSLRKSSMAVRRILRLWRSSISLALLTVMRDSGMTAATRMDTMAMTTRSSMRVKPLSFCILHVALRIQQYRRGLTPTLPLPGNHFTITFAP